MDALTEAHNKAEQGLHELLAAEGLTRREERAAALHQKYLRYVARFERWDNRKGWLRFAVGNPLYALGAIVNRKPLPFEWRRQPLSEDDFQLELFTGHIRRMHIPD